MTHRRWPWGRRARLIGNTAALVALAGVPACRGARRQVTAEVCAPPTGALAGAPTADALIGAYHLILVATSGPDSGARAQGSLALMKDDTLHFGSAEIPIESVGALRLGDLGASDGTAPGVRVLASPGDILLRLGSEANRAGQISFDGGYTVLRVREIATDGFRGVWVSGVTDDQAGGYFCAQRAG